MAVNRGSVRKIKEIGKMAHMKKHKMSYIHLPIKPLYSAKEQTHGLMIITLKNGLGCGVSRLTAKDWAVHLRNP